MKRIEVTDEPESLIAFRNAQPDATFDEMKADALYGGITAYPDIKNVAVINQRCLCMYCECQIADGMTIEEIKARKRDQIVEHFHNKEDPARPPNWNLHWPNLWVSCTGGSGKPIKGEVADPEKYLDPTPENLSCDKFKAHQNQLGKLPIDPLGYILKPCDIPSFPLLFRFKNDGEIAPNSNTCKQVEFTNNHCDDSETLVGQTIEHLNLNCVRLKNTRRIWRSAVLKKMLTL